MVPGVFLKEHPLRTVHRFVVEAGPYFVLVRVVPSRPIPLTLNGDELKRLAIVLGLSLLSRLLNLTRTPSVPQLLALEVRFWWPRLLRGSLGVVRGVRLALKPFR